MGNVVGTRAGREPGVPVMTGSHIDTVRTGGRYDGNLGVLAGLEVVEVLEGAGVTTRRPLAVAFFTNEEGSRFQPDMMGSLDVRRWHPPRGGARRRGHRRPDCGRRARAHRLCRSAAVSGTRAGGVRRAPHRARTCARGARHHDRRGRGRAGHLLARADDRRSVEPRGHDADVDAARRRARRRRDRDVRAPPRERARRAPSRDRRAPRPPSRPRERDPGPRRAHGRPPQHRCGCPCRRRGRARGLLPRARATGGRRDQQPLAGAVRPRDVRSRHRAARRADRRSGSATRCTACHRERGTTRR